jgi:S1-C subfamily serine protease
VTVGVVSAIGRKVQSTKGVALHDMIQTDAPLSPGSAGGALVDGSGVVVGITTAVSPASDPADNGLGFATPIDVAKDVADDIVASGTAHHVWLGIEGDDIDASTASALQEPGGVRVTKVVDRGPSAAGGLVVNDVITGVNNTKVSSMSALVVVLRSYDPGDTVTLTVRRGRDARTVTVTLGEKDEP